MATPHELARRYTDLGPDELAHLQRLLGSWGVLADLAFSDLILMVPVARPARPDAGPQLVVLGQMRPNNRPTRVRQDLVGGTVPVKSWPVPAEALRTGRIVRGRARTRGLRGEALVEGVPVRFGQKVVAVVARVCQPPSRRAASAYEATYVDLFDRLAVMVAESAFPFPVQDVGTEETPRVGDGVVVVDAGGRVEFASPNAVNAFHRMGVYAPPEGRRFVDLGIEESAVEWALETGRPVVEEVERRPDVFVLVHCVPLLSGGEITGAMILLRDVTDVRRLDRLLLSKDAAIREVHHRVKNNLQTISSLLSLQARRVDAGAGREALREAERRIRSIALVHEILSRDPGVQVPFGEIVVSLVQMAEDSVVTSQPVEISLEGDLGDVAADVATPLAVTLAELLQNAVEHAFGPRPSVDGSPGAGDGPDGELAVPGGGQPVGHVQVELGHRGEELMVVVRDDGCGLPPGFDIETSNSLGLSIVRDLVTSQLGGTIEMASVAIPEGGGTRVAIRVPADGRRG